MPALVQHITAFLSSPGGLTDERDLICSIVDELNRQIRFSHNSVVDVLRWENDTYPSASGSYAQETINDQVGYTYDLFIGLMWDRFGTPTAKADSGTEEEFDIAYSRFKAGENVKILFYFKKLSGALTNFQKKEKKKIDEFKNKLKRLGILYSEFNSDNIEKFKNDFRIHLQKSIGGILANPQADIERKDMLINAGAQLQLLTDALKSKNKSLLFSSLIHHAIVDGTDLHNKFHIKGKNQHPHESPMMSFNSVSSVPSAKASMKMYCKDLLNNVDLKVTCRDQDKDNVKQLFVIFDKPLKNDDPFDLELSYTQMNTMYLDEEDFITSGFSYDNVIDYYTFVVEFKDRVPEILRINYFDPLLSKVQTVFLSGKGKDKSVFEISISSAKISLLNSMNLIANFKRS
ncbi:DUF4062 domain-containing protein [Spirosoma foliorum]|uniref:DUF4062 domain-containing protein n=1 Tax=Spirosoma foliorum TaxID=2710596 RepID=A0A7G5H2X2_9BACT|nr:DUF4062 domain-containing protein [Spirosoma foliorum]QMW05464.1 DUF4062 domain-containing protein [Spirosoma foliorum]